MSRRLWLSLTVAGVLGACGGAPRPAPTAEPAETPEPSRRAAEVSDDCVAEPGKPPPKPLIKQYTGVAAKARCQREVYTIMGGLVHFLGVKCSHCHEEPDYAKMTHNKHVANWMARELIPSLQKRKGGGEVWCNDCHKGKAKVLGDPRNPQFAVEWMTTHLVEDFNEADGDPLRCKACHGGDLGSPSFKKKIILTDNLPDTAADPTSDKKRRPARAAEPIPTPAESEGAPVGDAGAGDGAATPDGSGPS